MRRLFVGLVSCLLFMGIGLSFSGIAWSEMMVETTSNVTLNIVECSGENVIWTGSYDSFVRGNKLCVLKLKNAVKNHTMGNISEVSDVENVLYTMKFGIMEWLLCIGIVFCLVYLWLW